MESSDYEVFKGVGFKDICQHIYKNQLTRKEQIDVFIADLRPLVKTVSDAMIVVPLIKGYMDTANTNDDHLVKLASIIQKLMTAQATGGPEGNIGLTEAEKKAMWEDIEKANQDLATPIDSPPDIEALLKEAESTTKKK